MNTLKRYYKITICCVFFDRANRNEPAENETSKQRSDNPCWSREGVSSYWSIADTSGDSDSGFWMMQHNNVIRKGDDGHKIAITLLAKSEDRPVTLSADCTTRFLFMSPFYFWLRHALPIFGS